MNSNETHSSLDVRLLDSATRPAVLYFPDGRPSKERDATHQIRVKEGQSVAVMRDEPTNHVTYVGTESIDVKRPCRYVLGVFHKRDRKLDLLPILGEGVLRMEPRVEGLQYTPSNNITVSTKGTEKERWLEGTRAALSTFGGSISKKRLRESELNRPAEQPAETEDAIESMVKSIGSTSKADGLTKKQVFEKMSNSRNLPPYHEDGRTMEEAFVFDEFCSPFHQERLNTAAFLTASTSDRDRMELHVKGESGFVILQIEKLKSLNDAEQHRVSARLCFLSMLLKVHRLQGQIRRTTKKKLRHFAETHHMDLPILEHLLSVFFEERYQQQTVKFQIPESKSRLLLNYILIVALMVSGSEMDHEMVDMLRTELKCSPKAMMQSFQSFGARIIKTVQHSGFAVRFLKDGKPMKQTLPKITETNVPRRLRS